MVSRGGGEGGMRVQYVPDILVLLECGKWG
jgi:hypothetical protein